MPTQVTTNIKDGGFPVRQVQETEILATMMEEVSACNHAKGWYDEDRRFGEDVALLHSEVSEMLEAFREHGVSDATVREDAMEYAIIANPKPEGVGSEAADVLVRLLDTCQRHNIDLFAQWRRKMDYNWTRPYRHGGKKL